jgi:hypothetical protein
MNYQDGLAAATRATAVEATHTPERYQRVRELAESQTRRLIADAKRELLLTALRRMIRDVYERDTRGRWVNILDDGRIIIPAPWAATGRRKWRMRLDDADTLRLLLTHAARLAAKQQAPDPVFVYLGDVRRWFLVLATYPTAAHALAWVDGWAAQTWTRETMVLAAEKLETSSPMGLRRRGSGPKESAPIRQALG